jgi:hypothetical protein
VGCKRTLKKYRSRPSCVAGALLPFHGVWPSRTITKHINDARVSSIGVSIHANLPTLPIFAVRMLFLIRGEVAKPSRAEDIQKALSIDS